MVSESSAADWIIPQILVYDSSIKKQKRWYWRPVIWKMILWGIPLILIWGVLGVFVPVAVAEIKFQVRSTKQNLEAAIPEGIIPNLSWMMMPEWVGSYALEIPKIGVKEQVVEAVDAANEEIYMEALKRGVAHARGTGLPGKGGVQYYFGHSSGLPYWGERAVVFGLLNRLEMGDEVWVYREQKKFSYRVTEKIIVNPSELEWMSSTDQSEQLVLQTCWPIGTNWKRLLVIAKPVEPDFSAVDRGIRFGKISLAMKRTK